MSEQRGSSVPIGLDAAITPAAHQASVQAHDTLVCILRDGGNLWRSSRG
jgi:hypothetical protein